MRATIYFSQSLDIANLTLFIMADFESKFSTSNVVLKSSETAELVISEAVIAQQNHLHADLCFICADTQKIKLHKLIVGSTNGFLSQLIIERSLEDEDATIIFPDVDGSDLITIVSAIYTGLCYVPSSKVSHLKGIVEMLELPLVFEKSKVVSNSTEATNNVHESTSVRDEITKNNDMESSYELEYVQIEELDEKSIELNMKPHSSLLKRNLPCLETTVVYRRCKDSNKFDRADKFKSEEPRNSVIKDYEKSPPVVDSFDGNGSRSGDYKIPDFQCAQCDFKSLFKEELATHKRSVHPVRHKCDLCGKTFSRKNDLSRHLMLHSGERKYACTFCDSKFIGSGDLHKHVRIHTGEKPYKCKFEGCGKCFTQKGDLNKHLKIHLKIKDHKCHLCDYSCIQGSDLSNHMLTHSSSKPFPCELCFKSFRRHNQLSIHMKRFHPTCILR